MNDLLVYLLIGIIFHVVILIIVHIKKLLSWPGGILTAAFISFVVYCANIHYWIILFIFFIPSSILSKIKLERKKNNIISSKAHKRNSIQVISNSFGLFLFALLQILEFGLNNTINLQYFMAGSIFIASASSDTWSTEIGTLSTREPRYILNLKKIVPKGTSGGVSINGTFGGIIGSIIIALSATLSIFFSIEQKDLIQLILNFLIIVFFGFLGQVIDSVLGATVQNKYFCNICQIIVEDNPHQNCGSSDLNKIHKYYFLNNNSVNFSSNMIVSLFFFAFLSIPFLNN